MSKNRKENFVIAGITLASIAIVSMLAACGGSRFLTLIEFNGLDVDNNNSSRVIKPLELAPVPGSNYHHHHLTNTNVN